MGIFKIQEMNRFCRNRRRSKRNVGKLEKGKDTKATETD
jgi:hypothetical protein